MARWIGTVFAVILLLFCVGPMSGCDWLVNAFKEACPACPVCETPDYACWFDEETHSIACDLPFLNGED